MREVYVRGQKVIVVASKDLMGKMGVHTDKLRSLLCRIRLSTHRPRRVPPLPLPLRLMRCLPEYVWLAANRRASRLRMRWSIKAAPRRHKFTSQRRRVLSRNAVPAVATWVVPALPSLALAQVRPWVGPARTHGVVAKGLY